MAEVLTAVAHLAFARSQSAGFGILGYLFYFSSENSVQSRHVKAELNLALDLDKKITTVRLDDARFGPDLEMYLSTYQYLSASDDLAFYEKLILSMDDTTKVKK